MDAFSLPSALAHHAPIGDPYFKRHATPELKTDPILESMIHA
jgi:hypothetical protein